MANIKHGGWFVYGALAGIILSLVLPLIIAQIVTVTGIEGITFSTYNVRNELTSFANQGNAFAGFLLSYIGGGIQLPAVLITAIGLGALMFGIRHLVDLFRLNLGKYKHMIIAALAGVIAGAVVSGDVSKGLPALAIGPIIGFAATAWLVTYVMEWAYKLARKPLPQ